MPSKEFYKISDEHKQIIEDHTGNKPVPLGAIAHDLGITVKLSALERGKSGLIECVNGEYRIKINRHEARERQRYTLAHEIAHFLLHRDIIDQRGEIVDNVLYRSGQPAQIEYEANRLAADLIMPEDFIRADLSAVGLPVTDEVIERLAHEWQVSTAAMEIRLPSCL
ncbi:MAG: ImmA/IrrE family metallo-endopeptidase [Defluviicoccus sp.]|nr:ImmA/IrrE family metallo-endopeptidase [Defluviicoccus sp.]